MNAAKRQAIFERLREANPKPRTELNYGSPFELLVAVVLSAQATDKGVVLTMSIVPVLFPEKEVEPVFGILEERRELNAQRSQLRPPDRDEERLHCFFAAREIGKAFGDEFAAGKTVHAPAIVRRGRILTIS